MPDADVSITANYTPEWTGDGDSWATAYLISDAEQLDLLSNRVNGGNDYNSKYFKVTDNLIYDTLTTDNYTAIGTASGHVFNGHFDGQGYTIFGINSTTASYNGLFGQIGSSAEVKNIILAKTTIDDGSYAGGIAGKNEGTITNCYATSTVTIEGNSDILFFHGGIVGDNDGSVSQCTFAGTLTKTFAYNNIYYYGGIAGSNDGAMSDNLVIGATIPSTGNTYGAIAGYNSGTLARNYYVKCTVAGVENATGVGCEHADVTYNDGAMPGNVRTIAAPTDWNSQNPNGWAFIASPIIDDLNPSEVTGLLGNEISTGPYNYDLYRLNPLAELEWENYHAHIADFVLANGMGYLYAKQEGVTLTFTGAFNTCDSTKVVLPQGFNLVGNPFPRAAWINKPYYTLNNDGSAVVTTTSSDYISPCHGVVVQASDNDTVTFTTTAPVEQSANNGNLNIALTQVVEPANPDGRFASLRGTKQSITLDNAIVTFNEGSELGKFYFGTPNANIYIPQNSKDYAIAFSDKQGEVPVNFKAKENNTYTISVNPEGVEMGYLHLIDNMTGADVDLLALRQAQGPASYTFTARTTDYESRFKLVFVCGDANDDNGDSETFAFFRNGEIIVNGEGTLQVIDVMGRVVVSVDGRTRCVPTSGMTAGVYVLRLINGENVKVQKIIVR